MECESRMLEYKQQASDLKKIAQTVVAFANGAGGRIVIGVEDKSLKVCGLPPSEIDALLEKLPVSLADQIQPPLFPQVFEKTIEEKEVLIIQVFPGGQQPYFIASDGIEKGVYIRIGAHTRRAEGLLLEELRLLRSHCGFDQAPMTSCPQSDLDLNLLPVTMRSEKSLLAMEAIRRDPFTGKLFPTRGGVLMLHRHPEHLVQEAYIIISRMRGTTGRDTVESHEIEGSLAMQSEVAVELLTQWLGRNPVLHGTMYKDSDSLLPPVVLREAINNALFHRQYSIQGPIKIALFTDRLEIFSPGHFAGPFIPAEIGDGTSYIRNKVICSIARKLRLIEKRGTGIRLIQDVMRQKRYRDPLFEEGQNWFKVTLKLTRESSPDFTGDESINAILELFERNNQISSADVCSALNVSKATAIVRLEKLIATGRIVRVGKGPKTKYQIRGY